MSSSAVFPSFRSGKGKESTKQPLNNAIQNTVESLLNDRGGGITVQQLIKHLSTTFEVWKEDQIVQEVKKLVKNKRLAIGKGTTERDFNLKFSRKHGFPF